MLDAILCPDWEYRYHSFNSMWAEGEAMGSMRNGSGDHYFILFSQAGAIVKGFDHESEAWEQTLDAGYPPAGLYEGMPKELAGFLTEPAFTIDETTFCLWRRQSDPAWQTGPVPHSERDDPDGSAGLLRLLGRDPEAYRVWAEDYFELTVSGWAVDQIFRHQPISEPIVTALNPRLSLNDLVQDATEIGYPTTAG